MVLSKSELIASLQSEVRVLLHLASKFRAEITMFGHRTTRGAFIVNSVLCGCAAYRAQLFVYLKACGREELSTMNLWYGVDPPAAV